MLRHHAQHVLILQTTHLGRTSSGTPLLQRHHLQVRLERAATRLLLNWNWHEAGEEPGRCESCCLVQVGCLVGLGGRGGLIAIVSWARGLPVPVPVEL
jgi:hypothetical protein